MTSDLQDISAALDVITPLVSLRKNTPPNVYFLVGGALRDALIGQPVHDVDIAASVDPTTLAQQFAEHHNAYWFWLDRERGQSRVLFKDEAGLTFDFAPLRAADICADLAARDFTINSMALSLDEASRNDRILDPLGGINDLSSRCLRMSGSQSFVADPLRTLKGIRHAVTLDLILDSETRDAMSRHAWRLEHVAVERIRQEVWRILAHPAAAEGLRLMSSTSVAWHFWGDVFDDCLERIIAVLKECRRAWSSMAKQSPQAAAWLQEEAEAGLSRETLLLWSFLLRQVAPGLPVDSAEQWQFSRRSQNRLKALALLDSDLLEQLERVVNQPRRFARWLEKFGLDAPDVLFVAAAEKACSDSFDKTQLISWISVVEEVCESRTGDLIDGKWLTLELGLEPGPEVGLALTRLRDAEIDGRVTSVDEAARFMRQLYQNRD